MYFGTYDYQAFAVNAANGEILFRVKTISQPVSTTHIAGDLFLVPQRNGQVTAFQINNGTLKWNHRSVVEKLEEKIDLSISGISIFGKNFYISKHWGNLYIANVDTGILVKDAGVTYESRINLPAIKTESGVLFSNVAGEIHCFKDSTEEDWDYTLPKGYATALYKQEQTLYIATTENELIALDLKTRTPKWMRNISGYAFDSIIIEREILFIQAKDLFALNPKTGDLIWRIPSKSEQGFCRGKPIILEDIIIAIEQNGRIIKAQITDGIIQREFPLNETIRSPLSANKSLIFIPTTQKRIYALDVDLF